MRSGLKLALTTGLIAVLVSTMGPVAPGVTASTPSSDQTAARRAELIAQLRALSGPRGAARAQLAAAEQQLASVESQLQAARSRLASLDATLLTLSRRIADDEHDLTTAKAQLASLIRATYETAGQDGFAGAILSSDSFTEAVDRVRGAQHVTDQVRMLQSRVSDRESSLLKERASLQSDFATAQALEEELQQESNRMTALVAQRDAAFQSLDGPARTIAAELAALDTPPSGSGPCGNHFAFGNCTYYVATRRCIPWFGNAYEWWNNAAAYGYLEGHAPQRGAVAVWGRSGSSPVGHVAYVEAVGPDGGVPAGSFMVSEMNYSGWDRVDYRTVPDNAPGLIGFIYGHP